MPNPYGVVSALDTSCSGKVEGISLSGESIAQRRAEGTGGGERDASNVLEWNFGLGVIACRSVSWSGDGVLYRHRQRSWRHYHC